MTLISLERASKAKNDHLMKVLSQKLEIGNQRNQKNRILDSILISLISLRTLLKSQTKILEKKIIIHLILPIADKDNLDLILMLFQVLMTQKYRKNLKKNLLKI